MANNSKPEQRKSNTEGLRASGGSAENEDLEDELIEDDEMDGQGIQAAGAQQDDDEDEVTESPSTRRASVEGELGQGRQARQAGADEGRGGRNARGR